MAAPTEHRNVEMLLVVVFVVLVLAIWFVVR
jgi:hypothetical protein